jgi:ATP-dependent Clp protease ATP-binding subunit ClpA
MTSNLAADRIRENYEDYGSMSDAKKAETVEQTKTQVQEELKKHLRPEFLNRIDEVIVFHPLGKDQISLILNILMDEIEDMLKRQELKIDISAAAAKLLIDRGYDPQFGARPLKRTIQRELVNELAKLVLAGEYTAGDVILVDADTVGLTFGRKMMKDGKEVVTKKLAV